MPTRREIYEATASGVQDRPFVPHLRSDPPTSQSAPHTLEEFRIREGTAERKRRLREVWDRLPKHGRLVDIHVHETSAAVSASDTHHGLTLESATQLKNMYDDELWGRCGGRTSGSSTHSIGWKAFEAYAEAKETGMCTF
jgi:solute carrier family 25 phosphate transporter 23/24/25/41